MICGYDDPIRWIQQLAERAQLALTPSELTRFSRELPTMLRAMDRWTQEPAWDLSALPKNPVPEQALREDKQGISLPREEVLASARDRNDACFLVSSVLQDSEKGGCGNEA